MQRKHTTFALILAGFLIVGPPLGGVIFALGDIVYSMLVRGTHIELSSLSGFIGIMMLGAYIPGLLPAGACGFYLARRATTHRPFVRRSYYLSAVITSLIPVSILLFVMAPEVVEISDVLTILSIPVIIAALVADTCYRIARRLLRGSPYALNIAPTHIPTP